MVVLLQGGQWPISKYWGPQNPQNIGVNIGVNTGITRAIFFFTFVYFFFFHFNHV